MTIPNSNPWRSLLPVLVLTFLLVPVWHVESSPSPDRSQARVIAVNDGDTVTILMNAKRYRTRLIGMDAPEIGQEPWGRRSREHLRKIVKQLRWRVLVETDLDQFDKYNRMLVYLWSSDGSLINEQMLLDGYAVLFTIQPNSRYVDRFREAQRGAREKKLGIWTQGGLKIRPLEYKKMHPRE